MPTGSPSLGMSFDALPPPADTPNLLNQIKSGSHNVNLGATYSSNPYLVFNTVSPNNDRRPGQGGRCARPSPTGSQRSQLQKVLGGPDRQPAAHAHPADRHRRLAGRAGRLRPVPVQPGQGQVHAGGRGVHREPAAADQVPVPQRQPGQHGDLQQRQQPAERARLGEGDRRAHQPVGLLRQVPASSPTPRATRRPPTRAPGTWPARAGARTGTGTRR